MVRDGRDGRVRGGWTQLRAGDVKIGGLFVWVIRFSSVSPSPVLRTDAATHRVVGELRLACRFAGFRDGGGIGWRNGAKHRRLLRLLGVGEQRG